MHLSLSEKQAEFLQSDAQYTLFCAGVGSGKTTVGAIRAVKEACSYPGLGLVAANTHKQLQRVTLRAFMATVRQFRIPVVFGRRPPIEWGASEFENHDKIASLYVHGQLRQVIASQLTNYDDLRGYEFRWFWSDEARDTAPEAFDVLMGRLRGGPPGAPKVGFITTTPAGFNWVYDRFVSSGEKALADRRVIYATSHDNPWLPPGYVASLLKNYSPRLAKQEIGGEFVSLTTGQAFAEFVRSVHVRDNFGGKDSLEWEKDRPLVFSWDFNVNPLCVNVFQLNPKSGYPHQIDEVHIEGSARTRDSTDELIRRYREHRGEVHVYGDRSGYSRDTRSDLTDFQIIEGELSKVFGPRLTMKVNYGSTPPVAASVQDVNNMLMNANGVARLFFHPRCEYTIRDLEQVAYKEGTREIDKSDPSLTHHADALRYYISHEFPSLTRKAAQVYMRGI